MARYIGMDFESVSASKYQVVHPEDLQSVAQRRRELQRAHRKVTRAQLW